MCLTQKTLKSSLSLIMVSNEVIFLFISNFSGMIRIKLIMIKGSIAET